jgi:hypothetical protein
VDAYEPGAVVDSVVNVITSAWHQHAPHFAKIGLVVSSADARRGSELAYGCTELVGEEILCRWPVLDPPSADQLRLLQGFF